MLDWNGIISSRYYVSSTCVSIPITTSTMELVIHELIFCKLIRSNVTVFDAVPRYNVNANRLIRSPFNGSFNGRCKHNTAFRDSRVISQIGYYTRQLLTSSLFIIVFHTFSSNFSFNYSKKERKKEIIFVLRTIPVYRITRSRRRREANEAERLKVGAIRGERSV